MIARFKNVLAAPVFEDEAKTRAAGLSKTILLIILAILVMLPPIVLLVAPSEVGITLVAAAIMALIVLGLLFLTHRGYVRAVGTVVTSAFFVAVVLASLPYRGVRDLSITGCFVVVVLAGLLLGGRAALISGLACVLAVLGMFYAETSGFIVVSMEHLPNPFEVTVLIAVLGMIALMMRSAVHGIEEGFRRARRNAQALAESNRELETSRDALEAHTHDLSRRARQLETIASIARDTALVLDLSELLSRVVTLISEQFGFYHTGIFMLDPAGEWAVLQAASSEGGQRMLAHGHRLKVGETGIVGYVTDRGEPRIALDVGTDPVFFDNPELPGTRSEMALPLRVRGEIIGALDVQSTEPGAFTEEDVTVLQTLADQVAVAISNARLFQQAQAALEAERRAYGEISRTAWQQMIRARPDWGYRYAHKSIMPVEGDWPPEMFQVIQADRRVRGGDGEATLAIPLRVHGQVLGVLSFRKGAADETWTAEEVALLETLVDQLGLALESARLYQDSQRRAAQERLTGEIAARMRETLDIDTVLQTAIREMGRTLGLPRVEVRMRSEVARPENGRE